MVITLSGAVTHKDADFAVIEAGGVGYQVFMNAPTLAALRTGMAARLWTHEHARDDGRELYGFATAMAHRLFKKLIGVSGVGPKTGLAIVALGTVDEIEQKIELSDAEWLSRVPGIGKKTAQKIILELKGKLVDVADKRTAADDDVLTALIEMGHDRRRAQGVLELVGAGGTVGERLRAALKQLGKR